MDSIIINPVFKLYEEGFRQQHGSTCGPASVILAATALGVEPKTEMAWRANTYAKWFPINEFLDRGMSLHELQVISELVFAHKIEIQSRRAYKQNLNLFKEDINRSFHSMNSVIIVNFRQNDFIVATTHPLGNPHYSPILGWDNNNQVLIADVDATLNFAYWLDIEVLFTSMSQINLSLGIPRGWLVVSKLTTV